MHRIKPLSLFAALIVTCTVYAAPPAGYKLVWSDEFNGDAVDEAMWRYRLDRKASSICSAEDVSITDGCMRINHGPRGDKFGGGGLITKRTFKAGYHETSVKMDGGYGWHEAFWTWHPPPPPGKTRAEWLSLSRIEIDCFEAKAHNAANEFSFGVIQWAPLKGNLSRENHQAPESLSSRFYTYGYEVTEDYVAFYFDDKLINVTNLAGIEQSEFNVSLTSIATHANAVTTNGCVLFDYYRYYEINPSDYPARRELVMKDVAAPGGYIDTGRPAGIDLWIEAEKFNQLGPWSIVIDENRTIALRGRTKKDKGLTPSDLTTRTTIKIPKAGSWRLWVRSRDSASAQPGARFFKATVNGKLSETAFGTHGDQGYEWQDGGAFTLPEGNAKLELIDGSQFFARCDRILLTRDLDYIPIGPGGKENTEHVPADGKTW